MLRRNEHGVYSPAVCVKGDQLVKIELVIDPYDDTTKTETYETAEEFLYDWNADLIGARKVHAWFELSDGSDHVLVYHINRFKIDTTNYPLTAKEKKELEISGEFDNFELFKRRLEDEIYFMEQE